ncbi:MAG: universal stress protein, partial [Nitrospirae bacterium]|nr:universal stress protein [Nitrospirota bacterium]
MAGFEKLLERKTKGSLKIYLGYAAGVGKTFAMLQEGHRLREQGYDVVAGYVEPHSRPDTINLMKGLESVEPLRLSIGRDLDSGQAGMTKNGSGTISASSSSTIPEMDVDGVIRRNPQIVLIDELAHTNAAGSKNEKRYQDVMEILECGINVITTLNIQHFEAIADKVNAALRVPVGERVPDYILQRADQIVNVDVTIEELRERLRLGKIYNMEKASTALLHFFTHENLSFLRKLALQEAADDQLRRIEEDPLSPERIGLEADEAVMVAISSGAPNAESLMRKAGKLAAQLSARCYVVYVQRKLESPQRIDSALQRKLLSNLKLAKQLGAEVVTLQGEDVAETLVNFAQTHKVRHAIFGKTERSPLKERLFGSVLQDFINDSVGIDTHIISQTPYRP